MYTNGTSETFLGDFLQPGHLPESMVLATKYTNSLADWHGSERGRKSTQEHDAVGGSELEALEDRLHRSILGPYLGPDHAGGRSNARTRRLDPLRQSNSLRHLRRSGLVDRASQYDRASAWMVAVCGIADRVQPHRAHRGARVAPDGEGAEHRRDGVVAAIERRTHRQVSRPCDVH